MPRVVPFAGVLTAVLVSAIAAAAPSPAAFESRLHYRVGTVPVGDGLATIAVPPGFRYLGPEDSRRLLVEGWDNPTGSAEGVLGMLLPVGLSPLDDEGWAFIITFAGDGHVDDAGAAAMDAGRLLRDLQTAARRSNVDRRSTGADGVTLVGWALPPRYDPGARTLAWGHELRFGDNSRHVLTYNVRVLGRRGVLELTAVALMAQFSEVHASGTTLASAVTFTEGQRYPDYRADADPAAPYGIARLVAGRPAAQTGVLATLWAAVVAWKTLIAGVAAGVGLAVVRLLGSGAATAG